MVHQESRDDGSLTTENAADMLSDTKRENTINH